jgi:hypothetical protein
MRPLVTTVNGQLADVAQPVVSIGKFLRIYAIAD